MSVYELKATDVARSINVSDSLVRKHIDGIRNCKSVDIFFAKIGLGLNIEDLVNNGQ